MFVDNGAIHAKSRVEMGIKFVEDKDAVPNPRHISGLWITLKRTPTGMGYNGAMPFELWIDAAAKLGYKKLSEQVNNMDKAVRGNVDLSRYSPEIIAKFGAFLESYRTDLWDNAPEPFRNAFAKAQTDHA